MKKASPISFPFLLIILVGFIIYFPAFRASFHLDDGPSIRDNAAIRHLGDIKAIWDFWPTRFFTYFSLAVNFHFADLSPLSYHATNIGIHIFNAVIMFLLLRLLLGAAITAPLFGSLLFLCHPLQTQAVTYVIQRATSLAACFYLLSVFFYLKARPQKSFPNYALSLLFCVLAMFTKSFTFSLPLVLIMLEFIILRDHPPKYKKRIVKLLPFIIALGIIPVVFLLYRNNPHFNDSGQVEWLKSIGVNDIAPGHGKTIAEYLITQPRVFVTYLRLVFLPVRQRVEYDENAHYVFSSFFQPPVALGLLLIAGLVLVALACSKKNPKAAFGVLWFIIILAPESSVIPILDVAVEHRLYLPLAGVVLVFSAILEAVNRYRRPFFILAFLILMIFAGLTYCRNLAWLDPVTLWEDNVSKAEGKARVHGNLGKAYLDAGRYERASREFREMIELDPTFAGAYNNLAVIYIDHLKDYEEARKYIAASLELFPDYPAGYVNRGVIYLNTRQLKPAIADFNKALELDPKNLLARYNLAACYINLGELDKAEEHLRKGLSFWPRDYRFYLLLSRVFLERGDQAQAEFYKRKAQAFRPALQ